MKSLPNLSLTFVLVAALFCLPGCIEDKDVYDPNFKGENPLDELNVPDDFDWKTTNSINLEVSITDQFNGLYSYLIEVFDEDPILNRSARKVTTGYARGNRPFTTVITLPKDVSYLYIRQTTPSGLSSLKTVSTAQSSIKCQFGESGSAPRSRAAGLTSSAIPSLDEPQAPAVDPSDTRLFPTTTPSNAQVLTTTSWVPAGNYILNGTIRSINVHEGSSLYITEDTELDDMNNIGKRNFYIFPGKKLTINKGLNLGQPYLLVTIPEGSELIVKGELKNDKQNRIYNLGTIRAESYHSVDKSTLYSTGEVIINGLSHIDNASLFYNISNVSIAGDLRATQAGVIFNKESISVGGKIDLHNGANIFYNDGDISSTGFASTGGSLTENNGNITVDGLTSLDANTSKIINNGHWTTENTDFNVAEFHNSCWLTVNSTLSINSGFRFYNYNQAYVSANELIALTNNRIEMYPQSFIDIAGTAKFEYNPASQNFGFYAENSNNKPALLRMGEMSAADGGTSRIVSFNGNMQVICSVYPPAMPDPYNTTWEKDALVEWAEEGNNTVEIPKTECNPGWNTKPIDPTDPPIIPEPEKYTYSYLFEDNWPLYGDYDMNDAVIRMNNLTHTIDKDNNVTEFAFDISLRAVGAQKRMAAALMLDKVSKGAVGSVSYSIKQPTTFTVESTGVESDQTNAVIPLVDHLHDFMGKRDAWYINTKNDGESPDNVPNPPVMTVTVSFSSPVPLADLAVDYLNLFIISDINLKSVQSNPRREIHQVNFKPSQMAETNIFGNNDDNSTSSGYYVSRDGLPWGIMVPDAFKWPYEYINIETAYTGFRPWVLSSGTTDVDWYKTPADSKYVYARD